MLASVTRNYSSNDLDDVSDDADNHPSLELMDTRSVWDAGLDNDSTEHLTDEFIVSVSDDTDDRSEEGNRFVDTAQHAAMKMSKATVIPQAPAPAPAPAPAAALPAIQQANPAPGLIAPQAPLSGASKCCVMGLALMPAIVTASSIVATMELNFASQETKYSEESQIFALLGFGSSLLSAAAVCAIAINRIRIAQLADSALNVFRQ